VPLKEKDLALKDIKVEVELGFDEALAFKEAQRCLNCDVQPSSRPSLCIECDACVDICPVDCHHLHRQRPEPSCASGSARSARTSPRTSTSPTDSRPAAS